MRVLVNALGWASWLKAPSLYQDGFFGGDGRGVLSTLVVALDW